MATYEQYLAQGKTPQQILDATAKAYGTDSVQYKSVSAKQPTAGSTASQPVAPTVKINTDVMRQYNPSYDPSKPTELSGTTGTAPQNQKHVDVSPPAPPAPVKPVETKQPEPQKQQPVTPVAHSTPESKPQPTDSVTKLTGGQNLTDLQKRSALEVYKTQGAQAAQRWVDEMSQYNKPTATADEYFNMIKSGTGVSQFGTKTKEYAEGKARYDTFNRFKGLSPEILAGHIKNGNIVEGTRTYNDLASDPAVAINLKKAKSLNEVNGNKVDTAAAEKKESENIMSGSTNVRSALDDGIITADELKRMMETPEITEKRTALTERKVKLDKIKGDIDRIDSQVDQDLEGKTVSGSYRTALKAQRRKQLSDEYNSALSEYNAYFAEFSDMTNTQMKAVEMTMQNYREEKAFERQQQLASTALDRQKEMAQFQSGLKLQESEAEFKQKIEQQKAMASDPVLATQNLLDEYKKIGVMAKRSDAEIIADVQRKVDAGQSLGSVLSQIQKDLQGKDTYKAYVAKLMPTKAKEDRYMSVGSNSVLFDKTTGKFINTPGSGAESYYTSTGKLNSPDVIGNFVSTRYGSTGVQCGALVNDWWKASTGSVAGMGDDYESKINAIERIGSVGSPMQGGLFVRDMGTKEGHTGIVQRINEDGSLTVREANVDNKETVQTNTYPESEWKKWRFSIAPGEKTYDESQIAMLAQVSGKTPTKAIIDQLARKGLDLSDVGKFDDGMLPPNETQKKKLSDIVKALSIIADPKYKDEVEAYEGLGGSIVGGAGSLFGDDYKKVGDALDRIQAMYTLENTNLLKGTLSNSDMEILKVASSTIGKGMTDLQQEATDKLLQLQTKSNLASIFAQGNVEGSAVTESKAGSPRSTQAGSTSPIGQSDDDLLNRFDMYQQIKNGQK